MKEYIKKIKKEEIIALIVGLLIGIIIMLIFYPERIAELKNKEQVAITIGKDKITADEIYDNFKNNYGMAMNGLIEVIDKNILYEKYELTDADNEEIANYADTTISNYVSNYGITEEEFLKQSGYETKEEFTKYIELDYLRNKYYKEYMATQFTDEEINDYYDQNIFGPISAEHILVEITEDVPDADAKALAQEILDKLLSGTSWDSLKEEYTYVIHTEDLTINYDSNIESTFLSAVKNLQDGEYSKSLVKTSYGYHIIYRKSSEEKPKLKTVKDDIITALTRQKETEDEKLYQKAMLKMREEAKLEIKDTYLKDVYKKYEKSVTED